MRFHIVSVAQLNSARFFNEILLIIDGWNDHSFVTMFRVVAFDGAGERHELGQVKIGFVGQNGDTPTYTQLDSGFSELPAGFFSLGTTVNYYANLVNFFSKARQQAFLSSLRDVVYCDSFLAEALDEEVFNVSLLRAVSLGSIKSQFLRVLKGGVVRTNYSFAFINESFNGMTDATLSFDVNAESSPPSNIHAIIGRNGVGKTTMLNNIVDSASPNGVRSERLLTKTEGGNFRNLVGSNYFSSVVLVSFSAFDPFDPPNEQPDRSKGTCIFYIGLKKKEKDNIRLRGREELGGDFYESLLVCFSDYTKKEKWSHAIKVLQSDMNFEEVGLLGLTEMTVGRLRVAAEAMYSALSSGHALVLLTVTKLVEIVEEKTLILLDEPESHLHPPLLSSFVRALSDLLLDINGVAILATHSPVILQEIPASCVWKVNRSGLAVAAHRPQTETFGENLGILTREVFGLEAESSGFHTLLARAVSEGLSYDAVVEKFNYQLGYEAQAVLRAMIARREARK